MGSESETEKSKRLALLGRIIIVTLALFTGITICKASFNRLSRQIVLENRYLE